MEDVQAIQDRKLKTRSGEELQVWLLRHRGTTHMLQHMPS